MRGQNAPLNFDNALQTRSGPQTGQVTGADPRFPRLGPGPRAPGIPTPTLAVNLKTVCLNLNYYYIEERLNPKP